MIIGDTYITRRESGGEAKRTRGREMRENEEEEEEEIANSSFVITITFTIIIVIIHTSVLLMILNLLKTFGSMDASTLLNVKRHNMI